MQLIGPGIGFSIILHCCSSSCEGISLYFLQQDSLALAWKWGLHVSTGPASASVLCSEAPVSQHVLKRRHPGHPPVPHTTLLWSSCRREHQGRRKGCKFCYKLVLLIHSLAPVQVCIFKLSLSPTMPQTTEHLLQGLPD